MHDKNKKDQGETKIEYLFILQRITRRTINTSDQYDTWLDLIVYVN